jgi:hypothetical protein
MNTFRPREVTPDFSQSGWSTGLVDRLALAPDAVISRQVTINLSPRYGMPMIITRPDRPLQQATVRGNIREMVDLD